MYYEIDDCNKLKIVFSERLKEAMDRKKPDGEEKKYTIEMLSKDMEKIYEKETGKKISEKNPSKSKSTGYFFDSINKWRSEKGGLPKSEHLYYLSLALDCDTDYLLGLQDEPRKNLQIAADKIGISTDAMERISKFYTLSHMTIDILAQSPNFDKFLNNLFYVAKSYTDEVKESARLDYSHGPHEIKSSDDLSHLDMHYLIAACERECQGNFENIVYDMIEYLLENDIKNPYKQ